MGRLATKLKITGIFCFMLLFGFASQGMGQNAIIGEGFAPGWDYNNENDWAFFDGSAGTSRILTTNANGEGPQFFRLKRGWGDDDYRRTEFNPSTNQDLEITSFGNIINPNTGTDGAFFIDVADENYNYIFKTPEGGGSNEDAQFIVFEVQGEVRTISSVTEGSAASGQPITITATLDDVFNTGQGAYLRYSTDDFASSTVVEMTGSGTNYSAEIAGQDAGTTVTYYTFTSGNDLTIAPSDADFYTINLNNNNGANYSIDVDPITANSDGDWSSTDTWNTGEVPAGGSTVVIDANVTLDSNQEVGNITVNDGAILSFTSNSLTVNGNLTNNGSFNSDTGLIAFTGGNTVEGTVSFNNVDLTGGVNFGSGSTVTGNLKILAGGFVDTNAPGFGSVSALVYETDGDYGAGTEWPTAEANAPQTVQIVNSAVDFGSTTSGRYINENLVIESGGSLALSTEVGGDLFLKGDWTNSGTFTANNRAVFFVGDGNQEVVNTSAEALIEIPFVIIDKANAADEIRLNADMLIASSLEINNGTLVTNDRLTLGSGALFSNEGTITGDINFLRDLTGKEGFRMLATPATATFSSFLSPIWTQGVDGADFPSGSPNVLTWDNTSTDGSADNWTPPTNMSNSITPGTGILVYVFDKDDHDDDESNVWPKTLSISGAEFGDQSPTVNSNDGGFTLLGNPFATTIDFNELDKTDLTDVAYVWDPNDEVWKTYPAQGGETGDLTDGLIAPFQGFFVQSGSGSPAVTFNDAAKSTGGPFYGKQSEQQHNIVRLEMNGDDMSSSTWLRFSENGSLDGQVRGDALKLQPLSSNYAQLATGKAGDKLFDINHLPLSDEAINIPLHVSSTAGGTFTLRATDFELPQGFELTFNDHATGESVMVTQDFEYQIQLGAAKANAVPPLKRLTQEPMVAKASPESAGYSFTAKSALGTNIEDPYGQLPEQVTLNQNYPNPFNPSTTISYQLPANSHVTLQVFDMLGRQVATLVDGQVSAGTHRATFDAGNLSSGMYIYRLQAGNTVLTKKLTLIK